MEHVGLGFKKLRICNISMLPKQAWRLINNINPLVKSLMLARYFLGSYLLDVKLGHIWATYGEVLLSHRIWFDMYVDAVLVLVKVRKSSTMFIMPRKLLSYNWNAQWVKECDSAKFMNESRQSWMRNYFKIFIMRWMDSLYGKFHTKERRRFVILFI